MAKRHVSKMILLMFLDERRKAEVAVWVKIALSTLLNARGKAEVGVKVEVENNLSTSWMQEEHKRGDGQCVLKGPSRRRWT